MTICMVAGWAHASIVATPTSLDVNFNDASDYPNNAVFRGFDIGAPNNDIVHDATGGIVGDGAVDFTANSRGLNWKQALNGTTINQTLVFTKNDLAATKTVNNFMLLGFSTDVDGHVTNPTEGAGSSTADAFQVQLRNNGSKMTISLKSLKDGSQLAASHNNMDYAVDPATMYQFDLSLELTAPDTFDWGVVVTDLGTDGSGNTVAGNYSHTFTHADFATALAGDGVFAGMRSANLTAGSLSGLDQWGVSSIPEPASVGLIGAFGGGILFIRRRFMM